MQFAVGQHHADVAVAVEQVFAGNGAVEFGVVEPAADTGFAFQAAADGLAGRQQVAQGLQLLGVEPHGALYRRFDKAAAAEYLQDVEFAGGFAVAGVAAEAAADAAGGKIGVEHEVAEIKRLFAFGGQGNVATLLLDVEIAVGALAVAQVPIAGEHQIVFDGRGVEIVQFGKMKVVGAAFGGQAAFFVPHEAFQIQAAAERAPAGAAEGNALFAGFERERVLQAQIKGTGSVEGADAAVPLVLLVQPAVGRQLGFERLAVDFQAACAADVVAAQRAFQGQIDLVDVGAAGQDVLAFEVDVERALRVGRAVQPEIDATDLHGARHF